MAWLGVLKYSVFMKLNFVMWPKLNLGQYACTNRILIDNVLKPRTEVVHRKMSSYRARNIFCLNILVPESA